MSLRQRRRLSVWTTYFLLRYWCRFSYWTAHHRPTLSTYTAMCTVRVDCVLLSNEIYADSAYRLPITVQQLHYWEIRVVQPFDQFLQLNLLPVQQVPCHSVTSPRLCAPPNSVVVWSGADILMIEANVSRELGNRLVVWPHVCDLRQNELASCSREYSIDMDTGLLTYLWRSTPHNVCNLWTRSFSPQILLLVHPGHVPSSIRTYYTPDELYIQSLPSRSEVRVVHPQYVYFLLHIWRPLHLPHCLLYRLYYAYFGRKFCSSNVPSSLPLYIDIRRWFYVLRRHNVVQSLRARFHQVSRRTTL